MVPDTTGHFFCSGHHVLPDIFVLPYKVATSVRTAYKAEGYVKFLLCSAGIIPCSAGLIYDMKEPYKTV